jgi:hypothetical protein
MVAAISSVYFEKIRKRQHGRLHCSEIFRIALTALFLPAKARFTSRCSVLYSDQLRSLTLRWQRS